MSQAATKKATISLPQDLLGYADALATDLKTTRSQVISEQGGLRPAIVVQQDVGNRFSPTTVIVAMAAVDRALKYNLGLP